MPAPSGQAQVVKSPPPNHHTPIPRPRNTPTPRPRNTPPTPGPPRNISRNTREIYIEISTPREVTLPILGSYPPHKPQGVSHASPRTTGVYLLFFFWGGWVGPEKESHCRGIFLFFLSERRGGGRPRPERPRQCALNLSWLTTPRHATHNTRQNTSNRDQPPSNQPAT